MSEEITTEQPMEQQPESGVEEVVEETAAGGGAEQQDDAQEAEPSSEEKPFDRKRFEAELRKKNSEAMNLRRRLKELEPLAQKARELEEAQKSEAERLQDQLARAQEQIAATRKRLVEARVQALASASFADPEDAVGALDLTSYISEESGDIDEAAIKADLEALLERKPHWAKPKPSQEGPRRPAPDRTQASGANKTKPPSPREEFAGWLSARLPGR